MSMPSSRLDVATSAGSRPALSSSSICEPLLAGDAAVVGADELLAGQLVEPLGEPLGEPPAVGEDDRAVVAADQLEDRRVDRRPDARPQVAARRPARRAAPRAAGARRCAAMSSTGTTTWSSSGLRAPASTMATSRPAPIPPRKPRDRLERPLRGGQADPLHRRRVGGSASRRRLEALEAEREVRAALRAGDRVDLVDDDVLDAAEDLARRAGQHQVQRLGRRDQDVGRVAGDLAPVLGRRVAGPAGDRDVRRLGSPSRCGRQGDPGQRRPEVALDVVGQRLERRDVQDADRAGRLAGRRGLGWVASRSRHHRNAARVLPLPVGAWISVWRPARDRGPAAGLRVGRRLEAGPEPVTDGGREGRERIGDDGRRGHGRRVYRAAADFDQMFGSVDDADRPADQAGRTARPRRATWPYRGRRRRALQCG